MERGLVFLDVLHLMNRNTAAMRYVRDEGAAISGSVHRYLMKFAS